MGLCLSCLESKQSTVDDEHTSLLSDDRVKLMEAELLTELRNKQLNAILNSTNDHMIDISTIKMMSTYGGENIQESNDTTQDEYDEQDNEQEQEIFKVIPISQSVIKEEMDKQYKEWNNQLGESTVCKYLNVTDYDPEVTKYTVDFV